jgi:hypothetical protein
MEHGLSSSWADVEHGAVSALDVALMGDLSGCQMAAPNNIGIANLGLLEPREMFFGNDEHVGRSFRIYVFKGEDVIVFVDFPGGDLSSDDAAEKAIAGGFGHACSPQLIHSDLVHSRPKL